MKIGTWLILVASSLVLVHLADPAQAQSTATAGYQLLQRGWVNDAIAAFERELRQNPRSLAARLGLAIAYQKAGQDSNAWQAYQRVLELDANNRSALAALGTLGEYRPEWQATGITALTKLLQITPNDTEARAQRALLLGYQGRFAESLADYQPLLQQNPKPKVVLGAAQIYAYSGNYAEALRWFNRYRQTGQPLPVGAVTAYALALESENPAEAVRLLEFQLQQKVTIAQAIELRAALARAYQANGQTETALQTLTPLRTQPQATLALARALSTIGRSSRNPQIYQESVELYRQVIRQGKPAPGLLTEAADVFSEWPASRREALELYQTLAQQQPNNSSITVKRLIVANQLGTISRSELRQQLQSVLRPAPGSIAEQQAIAQALTRLDPPDVELLPLYQSLQQAETVPFLNFRIAQLLMQKGDLAGAKQALAAYRATPSGARDLGVELLLAEVDRREARLEDSANRYEAILRQNLPTALAQDALFGLATVRRSQGRLESVVPLYQSLLAREPQNARTQIGLINLEYQLKQLTEADAETKLEQWLAAQPSLQPDPELLSLVAALPADTKREALYNNLLALAPDSIGVETRLIQVIARRDSAQARARMNQILERDRIGVDRYFLQGELARSLGDLELASQAYQKILQQQPDNVNALSALAGVRFEQKRYQDAEGLYQQVLVLRPNDLETHRVLADLYLAQDRPTDAFHQLKRVQRLQANSNPPDSTISQRSEEIQLNFLRRRGFQPYWERY